MKHTLKIKHIMTSSPITVSINDSINTVIQTIKRYTFDHLPVVDANQHIKGIISKSDLYKNVLSLTQNTTGKSYTQKVFFATKAADIMTKNPITVSGEQSIDYAIEILLQDYFHAIPVVKSEKIIGIITSKDILEYITEEEIDKQTREEIQLSADHLNNS